MLFIMIPYECVLWNDLDKELFVLLFGHPMTQSKKILVTMGVGILTNFGAQEYQKKAITVYYIHVKSPPRLD